MRLEIEGSTVRVWYRGVNCGYWYRGKLPDLNTLEQIIQDQLARR
jgi:hypothetical protein